MPKLTGYWPLGRTIADYSGNGNGVTLNNTTTQPGKLTIARYFNGTSGDYCAISGNAALEEKHTVMFWVKFADFSTGANGSYLNLFCRHDPSGVQGSFIFRLLHASKTFICYFYNGSSYFYKSSPSLPLEANTWYHVAFTTDMRDSTGVSRFYLNGVEYILAGDQGYTGTWSQSLGSSTMRVGYSTNQAATYKGWMEDLAFFRGLLTPKEINGYYRTITESPKSNPIADLSFFGSDYVISETAHAVDAIEYYQPTKWKSISETATASDTVEARNTTHHRTISEEATASDTLVVLEQLKRKELTEYVTATDAVEARNSYFRIDIEETVSASDSLDKNQTLSPSLNEAVVAADIVDGRLTIKGLINEAVTATDSVAFQHSYSSTPQTGTYKLFLNGQIFLSVFQKARQEYDCTEKLFGQPSRFEYTVWESLRPATRMYYTLDVPKVRPSTRIYYDLTYPAIFRGGWGGGLQKFTYNIRQTVKAPSRQNYGVLETTPLNLSKRMFYQIRSTGLFTAQVQYAYKVLLDSADVTSKIKSIQVSGSLSQYTGECSITWADPQLYTQLDPLRLMGTLRLEVYIGYTVETLVHQGSFLIEKRSVEIDHAKSYPTTWGRTVTAKLASPHALPITRGWDMDTTALTIAQDIIEASNTGVELLWQIANYRVLGGNFVAASEEPITLLSRLAEPIGGIVTTNKLGQLVVRYQYV